MTDPDDHALSRRIADEAGALLLDLRERLLREGTNRWDLEASGDADAHRLIERRLAEERPGDMVLSEEGRDDKARLQAERVWIVDPLDGTNEFGTPPRPDWAVHVALVVDHVAVAGAVALPAMGVTLATDAPTDVPDREEGPIRVIASRWHPSAAAQVVARETGGQLLGLGSAGAKAMAVVMGHADVYAHSGGQYEWDNCAPVVVSEAAGFHVSRIDGTPLRYNNPSVYLPDFLICRPELADRCLAALSRAMKRNQLWLPYEDY